MSEYVDTDPAYIEVMGREVPGTGLKNFDIYLLGEAMLNSIGTSVVMGWTSPAHSLDYIKEPTETDHVSKHIMYDFLAWVGRRKQFAPDGAERLRDWVTHEWLPRQQQKVTNALGMGEDA